MSATASLALIEYHRTHRWAALSADATEVLGQCATQEQALLLAETHGDDSFVCYLNEKQIHSLINSDESVLPAR